jgi:ribosomal protein S18 acetylase RimI-like enzyme
MAKPLATYVALWEREVVGTYYIKPNQPGLGSHICNAGYMVGTQARGRGVARAMCEHSQREGKKLGFRAVQFNLVVSSNEVAVSLWRKMGFSVVGTVPEAFHHQELGYVDALVMYKSLLDTS